MTRSSTQHSTVTSPPSSVSDVVDTRALLRKSSRDVGIVGQLDNTTPSITRKTTNDTQSYFDIEGSKIPVFQTPHGSPTPPPIPESATVSSTHPSATCHSQLTPEIGEAKDIHKPVVGPVVVDVNGAAPEAEADLDTAYRKKHDQPPQRTIRGDGKDEVDVYFNIKKYLSPC